MTFLATLVEASQRVGATGSRLSKTQEIATFLKQLQPEEIQVAVNFLSGTLRQGRIGTGYASLNSALPSAPAAHASLTVQDVDAVIEDFSRLRGSGSASARGVLLRGLLARATAPEQEFLVPLLAGELRQGALAGVMIEAIAAAAALPVQQVRQAAMFSKDLGSIARAALAEGIVALTIPSLQVFAPVSPMLAQTAADVAEALRELPAGAAFEWKMDGARIQLHKRGNEVRIYTRALNDVTAALPEIAQIARGFTPETLVLDGEAIAIDAGGRPHPFQVTMRRFGRKLDVEQSRQELPMHAYFFDCLLIDGEDLLGLPTRDREEALRRAVPAALRIPRIVTTSPVEAQGFYEAALAAGHEGVMAKSPDAPYEAGNRGAGWLKIKRVHTLDLVVLAAEWGHGRRTGKLSNLHLGALDKATGEFTMLGKTFKGLTDALLEWQTTEFLKREVRHDSSTVWIRPEIVVEIAFSDLQASKRYAGGLALRLARVKRYRTDKPASEADDMAAVRRLFTAQGATSQ